MGIIQFLIPYLTLSYLTPCIFPWYLSFGSPSCLAILSSLQSLNSLPLSLKYWCFPGFHAHCLSFLLSPLLLRWVHVCLWFFALICILMISLCCISCLSSRTICSIVCWTSQIPQHVHGELNYLSPLLSLLWTPTSHKPAISPKLLDLIELLSIPLTQHETWANPWY